jgi:peptidyl-prolyl cis-trans isomerase B (cyclophilin B)
VPARLSALRGLRHRAGLSKNWRAEEDEMRAVACAVVMVMMATQATGAAGQASTSKPAQTGAKPAAPSAAPARSPGGGPVIVFDTAKGSFEIETYPNEAPKTVALILELVKRNYYNGLRVHRYEPGMLVQWGDPQTRDMTKKADWGTRGSGNPVGVSEVNPKRPHRVGAVGAAWAGDPRSFDGQIYVVFAPQPQLNTRYTVWGQVISGMDVVEKLRIPDVIKRATVKQSAK